MLLWITAALATWLEPDMVPDRRVEYHTTDGWRAGVRHYRGEGPPVLLVHGMGANHYNWDYHSSVSMVRFLQERGWDVWVAELRGNPQAVPPNKEARLYSVDEHAIYDLPAILDVVKAETGEPQVSWVGHSMGGILLYTALELYPERIRAGVAIDSPASLEERGGLLGLARRFGWMTGKRTSLPVRGIAKGTAWMGRSNPFTGAVINRKNVDWAFVNGLARHALMRVPGPMQEQASSWLRSGQILRRDGSPWFVRTDRPEVPLLVTGGEKDRIVPPENAEAACGIFPACTYEHLGRSNGYSVDYGHVDPVMGLTAEAEVFPLVEGFLAKHRGGDAPAVQP